MTAVFDGYDTLRDFVPQTVDVDAVCFTDDPTLTSATWHVVFAPSKLDPNRAAKRPKCEPWRFVDADASVWIDASFAVTSPSFVADVLDLADPLAAFVHPDRDCIYDEAAVSLGIPKYAGEPIEAQVERYRMAGHPEHWGLWANGVLARHHTPKVRKLGRAWLYENLAWSYQDQLSLAPLMRPAGLRPHTLPGSHFSNPWVTYQGSARH